MKKNSVLRKVLAVSLAAAMLAGTGFTAVGSYVGTSGISVSAALFYNNFKYIVTDDNRVAITGCSGVGDVIIPDTIDGKPVVSISGYTFGNRTGITSVTIPDSVTSISDGSMFNGCTDLTNITVSENNTAFSSENGVLLNKNKERILRYPEGKKGKYSIPNSVTSIREYAFCNCVDLTSINLTNNIAVIEEGTFFNCANLERVHIKRASKIIANMITDRKMESSLS